MEHPRIGFLFNHDQAHQVAHSLPIALDFIERGLPAEIIIYVSSDIVEAEVRRIASAYGVIINLVRLAPKSRFTDHLIRGLDRLFPLRKALVLSDNVEAFRTLDALVVPDKTALLLRTKLGLTGTRIIHTRHGAGDRAIGFNAQSRLFDLVLVSGTKVRNRLIAEAGLRSDQIAVVGYIKFALWSKTGRTLSFPVKRPTVLYNPHPAPHLSSWFKAGPAILEWFRKSDQYNLIFAPHVSLFQRKVIVTIEPPRVHLPGRVSSEIENSPNIIIDYGSSSSIDMTYTSASDIYLGDASSQIYEFLYERRPALFINSHNFEYSYNSSFSHWAAGPVISHVEELEQGLQRAVKDHRIYIEAQNLLFSDTFDDNGIPPPTRASEAILDFLRR